MTLFRPLLFAAITVAGLAAEAHAERVTATLSFNKGDGNARPIRNGIVEILRFRPGFDTNWTIALTTQTTASGQLDIPFPYLGNGVAYQLRVYATNPAARVFGDAYPFLFTAFSATSPVVRTTGSPLDVHDLSFRFTDGASTPFFNSADAVQRGAEYAAARRDPRETDSLGQVAVSFQTVMPASFYDPTAKAIRLNPGDAMNDFSVLHEYAHYLEERISGFSGVPSNHNGCTATAVGADVMDPGFAWMEGFANYFPQAVFRFVPGGSLSGAQDQNRLENPSCPGVTKPRASIEDFVAAALYDLLDTPADGGDSFCSAGSVAADTLIFQIFDRELDIGFANPSLQHFVNAWNARGLDVPMLRRSLDTHGISVILPVPSTRYDMNPAANIAVFRPIGAWNSQWWVADGQLAITDWGRAGDVPVPADYDGDGLTDLAIWRPGDGTWWIIKSGSNQWFTQQWGASGDIPLPGDYDGDNEIDFAVYRPSNGRLYLFNDGCGFHEEIQLGSGRPVMGDFDGDGIDDAGIYDQFGQFTIQLRGGGQRVAYFQPGKTPLARDFDGDGRTDFATYDPNTGWWAWQGSIDPRTRQAVIHGKLGDVPVPADYDGDGTAELATWTPATGNWRVRSAAGTITNHWWGQTGDIPVPAP